MKDKEESVFRQEIRRDLATFRRLDGKRKLRFIYDYYKWYILVGIFCLIVIFIFADMIIQGQKPCRLRICAVLNTEDDCSDWFAQFEETLPSSDSKKGGLDLNQDQPFDYDNSYYYVQEIEVMTTVSSGRMDAAICGPDMYDYLLTLNACMPLDTLLPQETADTLKAEGKLVYSAANVQYDSRGMKDESEAVYGFYAIDLSDTAFGDTYNYTEEGTPLYLVIISNTDNPEDCTLLAEAISR